MKTLIHNARIINEGKSFLGFILIEEPYILEVGEGQAEIPASGSDLRVIDAQGKWLIPGVIDDQVHFREPGLTHKGDIFSESRAAVAGGITSFMEMPNTNPQTTTLENLEDKFRLGALNSLANYSFYMGTTNSNLDEIRRVDPYKACGLKIFMGASTGNMLVDNPQTLEEIFRSTPLLIAVHCEDESTIATQSALFKEKYGEQVPIECHPLIRNHQACYLSSSKAVELAKKHNARLHILHLSTAQELSLLNNEIPLSEKRISGEVCVHHLWFSAEDYLQRGSLIKWNPAVKTAHDRESLRQGLINGLLDVVATDHAPHTFEEKQNPYFSCPSGAPLVQHSLQAMIEMHLQGIFTLEMLVEKMCHNPAICFHVQKRGFLRKGYFADVVLIDPTKEFTVAKDNILYKCGWSPLSETRFSSSVTHTFINGHLVFENGNIDNNFRGKALTFDRK